MHHPWQNKTIHCHDWKNPSFFVFNSQVISVTMVLSHNEIRFFSGQAFRLHKQKEYISPLVPGNDLKHVSGPCRLFVIRITSSTLNIRCMRFRLGAGGPSSAYAKGRAHQTLLLARGMHSSSAWEGQLALKTMKKAQWVIRRCQLYY